MKSKIGNACLKNNTQNVLTKRCMMCIVFVGMKIPYCNRTLIQSGGDTQDL